MGSDALGAPSSSPQAQAGPTHTCEHAHARALLWLSSSFQPC